MIHNMKRILFMAVSLAILCSCGQKTAPSSSGSRIGYSLSFFKSVDAVSNKGSNVVVSPYSAGVALSMLMEGAEGQTRVEIDNALNGCLFASDRPDFGDSIVFKSANSVWINDDFSIRNRYVDILQKNYDALAVTQDFSDPATLHAINNWCSEHTDGKISRILNNLSPQMAMILANAIYFNADWETPFNENQTRKAPFYGRSGETEVDMMYRKGRYNYAEYQGYQLIELPYSGGQCSMFVVLPPEGTDIDRSVSYIDESVFNAAVKMLSPATVAFRMPKAKMETSLSLNAALKNMGVRTAYSSAADFSGIAAMGPLVLDDVAQKCYVDISERGTEAAAVTVAVVALTSVRPEPQAKVMTVNRPYVFFIADKELENILFVGKVVNL